MEHEYQAWEALEDRVLVRPDAAATEKKGLHIPESAREVPTRGTIVAVGEERAVDRAGPQLELRVGDRVIYGKYSGVPLEHPTEGLVVLIRIEDVMVRIWDGEPPQPINHRSLVPLWAEVRDGEG